VDGRRPEPTETPEVETLRGTAKRSDPCPHRSAADACDRIQAGEGERERLAWRGREERVDRLRARAREASVMSSSSSSRRRRRAHGRGPGRRDPGEEGRAARYFSQARFLRSHGRDRLVTFGDAVPWPGFTHKDAAKLPTDRSFPETGY
jgi:hypothetical protein